MHEASVTPPTPAMAAEVLAAALPFLRQYQGRTMVIKYGGNAMTEPALQAAFAQDVVMLQLVGIRPVIVHGGGPQIEAALKRLGLQGAFIQGMRVTDGPTMQAVEWVLSGEVQQQIVGLINQAGGKAVGLSGRDGGLLQAEKLAMPDAAHPGAFVDLGQVGDVVSVDTAILRRLQDAGCIPVISPVGVGANNESYNINADVVAARMATALQAEKLLMLTNISGVLDGAGKLMTRLSAAQIDAMVADGMISGGMIPKISGALEAAKAGVQAVHIVDGRVPHVLLLEILTGQAFGTMIYPA